MGEPPAIEAATVATVVAVVVAGESDVKGLSAGPRPLAALSCRFAAVKEVAAYY